jgi:erythritol transport system permease protein
LAGIIAGGLINTGLVLYTFGVRIYFHTWLVVVIALLAGACAGALNGALVSILNVPPFIATLGSLYVARGAALLISNGATFPDLAGRPELRNTGFSAIGSGMLLDLPAPIWLMLAFAVAAAFIAGSTPFGRRVYAVGGNERAAELSGVRVRRVKFAVYVISGFCAAMVGVIIASQLGAAHPATGETFELNAIAAVVLGGASLMGGRGTIANTIAGAFVIGVLADGLVLLGVSQFWQIVIKGAVIVLAVVLDQLQQRYARRAAAPQGAR